MASKGLPRVLNEPYSSRLPVSPCPDWLYTLVDNGGLAFGALPLMLTPLWWMRHWEYWRTPTASLKTTRDCFAISLLSIVAVYNEMNTHMRNTHILPHARVIADERARSVCWRVSLLYEELLSCDRGDRGRSGGLPDTTRAAWSEITPADPAHMTQSYYTT